MSRYGKAKNLINFIAFILLMSMILEKVTWIFRGNVSQDRNNIVGFHNETDLDVILFGASDCWNYYQPMEAWKTKGYTSYDYATTVARMDMLKYFAEDAGKTVNASLYVFNLRTLPLLDSSIHHSIIQNWADSLPLYSLTRIKGVAAYLFNRDWKVIDLPMYFLDIIYYHSEYGMLASADQWKYVNSKNIDSIDKGFRASVNIHPFLRPEVIADRGELTKQQNNALIELLDYCDKKKLNALFIVAPYIITENDWLCFNTAGDIIRGRGYQYVNFNECYDEIGLDFESDFADCNHVNFLGAEKYTAYLSDYLVSHYDLPDHRGDERYSEWDADYKKYVEFQKDWRDVVRNECDGARIARTNGQLLSEITDFDKWYLMAQDKNYSLLIVKKCSDGWNTDSFAFWRFVKDTGMDLSQEYYAGILKNGEQLYFVNHAESKEDAIGIDGWYTRSFYRIESGEEPSIIIDGVEYVHFDEGIHIVVFDDNYMEVYDSITLVQNGESQLELLR